MSNSARLKLISVDCFEQPFKLRLPFRFGSVTHTHGRQAIVRARIRLTDGRDGEGFAAEALGAKWFDKNPALSDEQNLHQLRCALQQAITIYRDQAPASAFDLFARCYRDHLQSCAALELPALVASFGPALLDRAILDALCRIEGVSFWRAMRSNLVGFCPALVAPDLADLDADAFLASLTPLLQVQARHTVGLVDPITAVDQSPGSRVDDGLPETLHEVLSYYGNRYFKLKVSGQLQADLQRLRAIAAVLDTMSLPYYVSLDGNEQYEDAQQVTQLWQAIAGEPKLQRLAASTLFIEQPIKRANALSQSVAELARVKPVIIDESDGDLDAFVQARALGYRGVSSKACKGFYKSLINLARCRRWNTQDGAASSNAYFMSGEDLTTQAGISVQQDLALVSLLGISHVERNGHHFIDGFGDRPRPEAQSFLQAHPDLYRLDRGRVRLSIVAGSLRLGSLECAGFGTALTPALQDTAAMPAALWPSVVGQA